MMPNTITPQERLAYAVDAQKQQRRAFIQIQSCRNTGDMDQVVDWMNIARQAHENALYWLYSDQQESQNSDGHSR